MTGPNKYHNGQSPSNGQRNGSFLSSFQQNHDAEKNNDEIDLKQVFYTLWNRKWIIIGAVFLCGLLAAIYAYSITPIYQSGGTLLISEPQNSSPLGADSELGSILSSGYGLGVGSTIANEIQILRSRKLSEAVADTLMSERSMPNGRQFPILFRAYPDDSTMTSQDTVAARIRKRIVFSKIDPNAEVVQTTFTSPVPYEAARVVNLTMRSYKELSTHQKRSSASSAVTFLEKEKKRIKGNLQDAEERMRSFMKQSKLVQVDTQTQQLIEQMSELESQRQQARTKLVAAKSAISQYQERLNKIKPGLADQYSEAIGPNISKLQYAKSELELKKQQMLVQNPKLDSSSPQLKNINTKIDSYSQRIKDLVNNLVNRNDQYLAFLGGGEGGVTQNVSELNKNLITMQVQKKQYQSQVDVINTQLQNQQQFFDDLPDNMVELAKIKRDVEINQKLYNTVSQQYAKTALMKQTQFGLGRIVDTAYIPHDPVKPQKELYVLIGFILGGVFVIGYILVSNAFDTTIDGAEKMKKLDEPLLAVVPTLKDHIKEHHNEESEIEMDGRKVSTDLITVLDSISPISESFRRLESNLIYSNPDTALNTIMVTSSGKGEGKTTTIANLGVVLSEAGYKTLIVDTDFRRPNLHNVFGMKKVPGLVEMLFDEIDTGGAIQASIVPGLSILSAGRRPPNAAAVSQSQAFVKVLSELKNSYDFILIDTAPMGIINDSSALLRHTDGVVVISKFGETTEVQLSQTLEQLHRLRANVVGTVLTAFDYTQSNDYYLSSGYYKQVYQDYNDYEKENR